MKWLRISENRPSGGTAWYANRELEAVWLGSKGIGSDDWFENDGLRARFTPTHWMPITPPPLPASFE